MLYLMSHFTKKDISGKSEKWVTHRRCVYACLCILLEHQRIWSSFHLCFPGECAKGNPQQSLTDCTNKVLILFIHYKQVRVETKTFYSKPGSTNRSNPLRVNEMYVYVIIFTVPGLMSSKTTSATVNCFSAWSSVSVFIKLLPHNTNSSRRVTTVRGEGIRQQCANERENEGHLTVLSVVSQALETSVPQSINTFILLRFF